MLRKIVISVLTMTVLFRAPVAPDLGVETMVSEFSTQTGCKNVSVVVYDNGDFSYYGDSEGLYQIGSMTKSFTGLAVQKLINEGKLSGDDKVSDLIPGFKAFYESSEAEITVDDLLKQRSGYTNSETDYPSATEDMTLQDWAESISGKELKTKPGEEYSYSNVNYNLLGVIIENVTGISYREYMEENILVPYGLDSTYAGVPGDSERIVEGSRLGFRNVFEYKVPVREGSIPAGYFYSDAEDIGIWLKAWIENTDADMDAVIGELKSEGDCYAGWERFEDDVIGHSGGTPNYSSRMVFSRSRGIGVCVLTNINVAATTDSLCNSVFTEVSGMRSEGLICDVWTVFDIIFTSVYVLGIVVLILALSMKKKGLLIACGSFFTLAEILILVLFPIIFGAGIKDIALIWAPWSFLAGIMIMAADVLIIGIKLIVVKVNEGRAKTG